MIDSDKLVNAFLNREEFKISSDGMDWGCDERAVFYYINGNKNVFCLRLGIDGIEKHSLRSVQNDETTFFKLLLIKLKEVLPKNTLLYSDTDSSSAFLEHSDGTRITYNAKINFGRIVL